jgi:hypothetical protein
MASLARRSAAIAALALLVACADGGLPSSPSGIGPGGTLVTVVDVSVGIDVTAGYTGTTNWAGQSFTVPPGSGYRAPRFNWYSLQKERVAFGQLHLLAEEYLGLPGDLGPSTRGFVARSERTEDGSYVFGAGVVLDGGSRYWVYTDRQGNFAGSFDTDIYAGGDMYVTGVPTLPFRKVSASGRMVGDTYVPPPPGVFIDANFRLQGLAR